ncbi:ribosome biogenesis protein NOP53 isoform X2 [Kryptolebias marmoratus]|uniref:ribosome biogenesis protein NOP53 isoform X2 n=1 Tax=Kryptolebias marmoratus TaxID=37003 RepID=UPI0007F93EDF|nr:ribosome biogenesis protein NOP53 isoform X2 [Kryptolebias marmoratus]
MAAARRLKRVAASQPGFLTLKPSSEPADLVGSRRKRVNKNKKKNWNKFSDIADVEEFLEDVRHQERTTGGLLSEKSDDTLFFVDLGQSEKPEQKEEPDEGKKRKGKASRPLRIDLILQHDSHIPPPKDVLAYQQPNAKKLRRIAQKAEQLAARGVVPRRQKRLLNRRPIDRTVNKAVTEANNNPDRGYYNLWGQESKDSADPWYLQQTGKKLVKRPEKLNEKPSVLPAVEVIAPGGSYNPDFFSHQVLLQEAHNVEVKKKKQEDRLEKQLAVNKEDRATEETALREVVEGLIEEEDDEVGAPNSKEDDEAAVAAIAVTEKKTERQRKKEKAEKIKEQQRLSSRRQNAQQQQLFQLRSIKTSIKQQEQKTKKKQVQRKAQQEAQKAQPRRLGKLKFQTPDLDIQLSDELAGSLRQLKPEGSILKDRFKSLQKRNLIEPRERAKFKRRLKLKYVEKRAFKEIT